MLSDHPEFISCSLLLKYGPYKDALLQAYESNRKPPAHAGVAERAEFLRRMLMIAARARCSDAWCKHCGKNVSHVQGPILFLRAVGIVRKLSAGSSVARSSFVNLGKGRKHRYLIIRSAKGRAASLRKLERTVLAGSVFGGIVRRPPRTLAAWNGEFDVSMQILKRLRAPQISGSAYLTAWVLRGGLCTGLAYADATLGKRSTPISDLLCAFPDQNRWTIRLARHFGVNTVGALFRKLKYDGKVEHFSMHLCFYASPSLDAIEPRDMKRKRADLLKLLTKIRKRDGMNPGRTPRWGGARPWHPVSVVTRSLLHGVSSKMIITVTASPSS